MAKLITQVLFVFLPLIASVGDSRTLRVAEDGSGDFTSVVPAVQAAQPGDTVQVAEGLYYTDRILLDRPLVLLGAGAEETALVNNFGGLIGIQAEGCVIEGFALWADTGSTRCGWTETGMLDPPACRCTGGVHVSRSSSSNQEAPCRWWVDRVQSAV